MKIIRLLLPFLVLFFVIFCSQQEDFVRQQKRKIEVKDVKRIDLLDDPVFSDAYAKLTKGKISARGGDLGKSVLEEQFGFTIDTAHAAKMIEANGYVTYTMLIKRDSVSNAFFENLLITVD
jgi:hypothetical protein